VIRRLAILFVALAPSVALAGGLEIPGNGTEALGRGAAFTAKADDGTALEYNVAGLARQRGTRLMLDVNALFSNYEFQRAGNYPDDPNNAATPWGGQAFPKVHDTGAPTVAPFIALSTDFGVFDRWTFAVGLFAPSSVGNRTYPLGVNGFPSPSRYDVVQASPLVVYPTLAIAVRIARWLDLGLELQVPVGKFDLTSVSFTDLGSGVCKNAEYQPCDAVNRINTVGVTATAALGLLIRPAKWIAFGVHARAPFTINSDGNVHATPPAAINMAIPDEAAHFQTSFPLVMRFGLRFIVMKGAFEAGDIEADATYENWAQAQGDGPKVNIPELSIFTDIHPTIQHHYHDTFSLRLGGSVNVRLGSAGVLSFRLGGFYDSSATDHSATRLDFDTLDKIGITGGISYKVRGFGIHIGYAYLFEGTRVVTDGDLRPINGAKNGTSVGADGSLLPPVNNGVYTASTQILSLGLSFAFDEMANSKRVIHYRADYEDELAVPRPQAKNWKPSESGDEKPAPAPSVAAAEPDDAQPEAEEPAAAASDENPDGFAVDVVSHKAVKKHKAHKRIRRHRGRR
jgi:long-subunit fatty acid transport protein